MNDFMLFFIYNQFVLEYFITACILAPWKDRRKFWFLTMPLYFLTYLITTSPLPEIYEYPLLYLILTGIFFASFKVNIFQAFFYATDAYALQFTISSLYYLHTPSLYAAMQSYFSAYYLKIALSMLLVNAAVYLLIVRKRKGEAVHFHHTTMILSTAIGLLVFIYLSYFYKLDNKRFENDVLTINIVQILFAFCGLACILFNDFNCQYQKKKEEQEILELLIKKDKAQYEQTRNLIELIKIKEHDLKRKMEAAKLSDEEKMDFQELKSHNFSRFATGNESIDVVLSEYSYICNGKNIQLLCSIDGKLFSFMKSYHIASLFNNALCNAVNYLEKIQDDDKKIIRVSLQKYNDNIMLVFQNYIENVLQTTDDLPMTTNENKTEHGYGLKSIKHIASLYDGHLTIQQSDNLFSIMILFTKSES